MFDEKPIKKFQERFYQKLAIDKAINDLNDTSGLYSFMN